jgi:hypothetical protein
MIHIRHLETSLAIRDEGDGRTLVGPVLPWGVEARVLDRGRLVTETFERGALADVDPARVPSPPPTQRTPARCRSASP